MKTCMLFKSMSIALFAFSIFNTHACVVNSSSKITQHQLDECLVSAVQGGWRRLGEVRYLLARGANPNRFNDRFSLVGRAVIAQSPEMVQAILDAGADAEARSYCGTNAITPLIASIRPTESGEWEASITQLLLNRKANLEAKDSQGNTALTVAAFVDNFDAVQLLLRAGANVHTSSYRGITPLMACCGLSRWGHHGRTIAQLLISYNANVHSALHSAAAAGNVPAVEFLLKAKGKVDTQSANGWTPLMTACNSKCTTTNGPKEKYAACALLLKHGANPNHVAQDRSTPLTLVAYRDHLNLLPLLLSHGANINYIDVKEKTPSVLAQACVYGRALMTTALAKLGADLSERSTLNISERITIINSTPYAYAQWMSFALLDKDIEQKLRKEEQDKLRISLPQTMRAIGDFRKTLQTTVDTHTALGDASYLVAEYIQLDPHSKTLAPDIAQAARCGDLTRIKNYLDAGGNIEARTPNRNHSMLELAQKNKQQSVVDFLTKEYQRRHIKSNALKT